MTNLNGRLRKEGKVRDWGFGHFCSDLDREHLFGGGSGPQGLHWLFWLHGDNLTGDECSDRYLLGFSLCFFSSKLRFGIQSLLLTKNLRARVRWLVREGGH